MVDTQILDQDFLDKDQIFAGGEEEEASSEYFYNQASKAYKCCHAALKRQTQMATFWLLFLVLFLGAIGALYGKSYLDFSNKKTEAITVIPFAAAAAGAIIAKIVTLKKQNKYYSYEKPNFVDALPEQPNKLMQEFYVLQQCRKCSQYWITLVLVCLSFTTSVYGVIASGILRAAQQQQSKLFESGPDKWFGTDTCTTVTHVSWMLIPIWFALYSLATIRTNKIIKSLEELYPSDQIIDIALCNHRLALLNRKLKIFSFATIALLGCVIFLFTKKFLCTLFRRSFHL
ncbi:hypothetical protein A6V39_02290 [Candidatus Mycoplasma haematobovis]|uniref:Transmembrane protein n=1 Tax=Candidatus Mycoplasma haematobovis TaxID=432608 RepID=A0A1A9QE20_9MOLU|nr:hypothetical protein [Candidatus Mycoplasma haematobovis]OAL10251.1 hypothetical protein A6V39_02290 [Candidatus Mycoplasma haematobovis]